MTAARPRRVLFIPHCVKKPPGSEVVTRQSRWGNSFKVSGPGSGEAAWQVAWDRDYAVRRGLGLPPRWFAESRHETKEEAHAAAVAAFRRWIAEPEQAGLLAAGRIELRGKDLACFYPPGEGLACHADVWLELVND